MPTARTPAGGSAEQRLTELFAEHHGSVVAYVARRTRPLGNMVLAEDVASEAFSIAWRRVSEGQAGTVAVDGPPEPTLPWLLVTARNVLSSRVRDDSRRTAREVRAVTDRSMAPDSTAESTGPALIVDQVTRALDQMRPDDREVLLLRVWDELSFADAAAVLGCTPGAVRVRWLRARRRFAAALALDEEPAPGVAEPAHLLNARPTTGVLR